MSKMIGPALLRLLTVVAGSASAQNFNVNVHFPHDTSTGFNPTLSGSFATDNTYNRGRWPRDCALGVRRSTQCRATHILSPNSLSRMLDGTLRSLAS